VQTCQELYIAGHQPELWRDLVLHELQNRSGGVLTQVGKSWRDTFILQRTTEGYVPHIPIQIRGFYSDYYFKSHLCRSFGIPDVWLSVEGGTIDRVDGLSVEDFLNKYEISNKPVVLVGACRSWKAFEQWKNLDYLLKQSRGRTFRATSGAAPLPASFSLPAYFDYCQSKQLEEAPLYLFDRTALSPDTHLYKDYFLDLQNSCPWFDPSRTKTNTHDLFKLLGEGGRPDHTWLIMGPQRSGSAFHIDPNATHAWNACIMGRKRWIFYPPGVTPPGVHPSPDGDDVAMPISLGEWIHNYWNKHLDRCQNSPLGQRPLECTVEPGDILFVPHGWWHSVLNLDKFNIAVTHNYVSRSNLPTVLRFLQRKQGQISGCRDRKESIKPENLYDEFCKALQQHFPEWLQEAQVEADKGWTCAAWSDANGGELDNKRQWVNGKKRRHKMQSANTISDEQPRSILAKIKMTDVNYEKGFSFSFL
jgi:hypothetical protein